MLLDILKSIGEFIGVIKKNQCQQYLESLYQNINDNVIPTLKQVLDTANLKIIKSNKQLTIFANQAELGTRDNYKAIEKIYKTFTYISACQKDVQKLIDLHFPNVVSDNVVKIRDRAIMKLLQDLFFMANYTLDLMYIILLNNDETDLPKRKIELVKAGIGVYITVYKAYSKSLPDLILEIAKMSDEEIPDDLDKLQLEMKEKQLMKNGSLPYMPMSGFIGNPIYHIRMWLIDRDFKKVEALKIKKQLIELKLMELKMKEEGQTDPSLSKQIKYYEDKLASIEYDIERLQK